MPVKCLSPAAQLADSDKDFEPDLQATILHWIIQLSYDFLVDLGFPPGLSAR